MEVIVHITETQFSAYFCIHDGCCLWEETSEETSALC